jgi:signal transduction histidine kinase
VGSAIGLAVVMAPVLRHLGELSDAAIRTAAELRAARDAAEEANRLKSQFLAGMSHELRTPLNAIIGFSEILLDRGRDELSDEQRKTFLQHIHNSGHHLLALISDVLDMANVEAGEVRLAPQVTDLRWLANDVCATLEPLFTARRLDTCVQVDAQLEQVVIDPGRLRQVLYNYLSNAIKFTPPDGRITVQLVAEGDGVFRVSVTDTGPGIRPEDMDRLFQEFQQVGRPDPRGTGLGLALTRRIVEALGGRVWVEGRLGEGSTFSATLPWQQPLD